MSTEKDNARKYTIQSLPPAAYLSNASVVTVRQGYLSSGDGHELKIVEKGGEFMLIAKATADGDRTKTSMALTEDMFKALYPFTEGRRILKKTYTIQDGAFKLRFDEFLEETKMGALIMLEVSGPDGEEYSFPYEVEAIGRVDVSDDPRYLNQNLAN